MLAADKLQLQSALKQQATALKEKEFNLHHTNLMTVGTQAAVLAGLDITMFIEFQPDRNDGWGPHFYIQLIPRVMKFLYYVTIIIAFCSNMMVVAHTTALSVLGAGLALRGPDGSMVTATDGLYEERRSVFFVFGIGLGTTVASVCLCVWLILHWEAAFCCTLCTIYTIWKIHSNYKRIVKRFSYDESETVDFTDIFDGPAAITAVPKAFQRAFAKQQHSRKTNHHRRNNGKEESVLPNGPQTVVMNGSSRNYPNTDHDNEDEEALLHHSTSSLELEANSPIQKTRKSGMNGSGGRFRRKQVV